MCDVRDESVFPIDPDIDIAAMGLVLMMVRAQQMNREGPSPIWTAVECPPITEQEVWGWRN